MKITKWLPAVAASLLLISGCSSSSSGSSSTKSKVEISLYANNQGGTEYLNYLQNDVIKGFETENPDIKIKLVKNGDSEGLAKQQLAAGGGPDVITLNGPTSAQDFAAADYLLPLDKYAEQYKWADRYYPWAYQTVQANGKQVALPGSYETLVVYYNKDLFKKNGWEIPTSYDELVTLSKKMDEKGVIPFAFGSSDFKAANEWWLSLAFNETLGADNFKKVLTGETPWNSPEMKDAITKLNNLWTEGYINDKQSQAITLDDATTLFMSGKAAMKMEGTWMLTTLKGSPPPFDWDVFIMPSWKDGTEANLPLALGGAVGINKNSKHPDETAKFLDWMHNKQNAEKLLELGGFLPVNGLEAGDLDPHVQKSFDLLNDAMANNQTGYAAWTYWPPSTETYAWSNIESVWLGQIDVDTYIENLQKKFEKDKEKGKLFKFN
jgi:raffinose/stachyose/melibiose transport system substrate-binding protein